MNIAYLSETQTETSDRILHMVASELLAAAGKVCGIVQANVDRPGRSKCDMGLLVLPAGPRIRISQDLGTDARGCRLDPGALEEAVRHVESAIARDFDLPIVNKFGKREAEGRGFRSAIAEGVARGFPVLVGVSPPNETEFSKFVGGQATSLPANRGIVLDWCQAVLKGASAADAA